MSTIVNQLSNQQQTGSVDPGQVNQHLISQSAKSPSVRHRQTSHPSHPNASDTDKLQLRAYQRFYAIFRSFRPAGHLPSFALPLPSSTQARKHSAPASRPRASFFAPPELSLHRKRGSRGRGELVIATTAITAATAAATTALPRKCYYIYHNRNPHGFYPLTTPSHTYGFLAPCITTRPRDRVDRHRLGTRPTHPTHPLDRGTTSPNGLQAQPSIIQRRATLRLLLDFQRSEKARSLAIHGNKVLDQVGTPSPQTQQLAPCAATLPYHGCPPSLNT